MPYASPTRCGHAATLQNSSNRHRVLHIYCMPAASSRLRIELAAASGRLLRATELDVPPYALAQAEKAGAVHRVTPGIYIGANVARRSLAEAAAWCARQPEVVACLLTAAVFHNLTDAFERGTWLFVPLGCAPPRSSTSPVHVVQVSPRLVDRGHDEELGIQTVTVHGVRLRITSPDRTVLDLWRYPKLIAGEHALSALRRRSFATDFSIPAFARLADTLEVWKRVEPVVRGMLA